MFVHLHIFLHASFSSCLILNRLTSKGVKGVRTLHLQFASSGDALELHVGNPHGNLSIESNTAISSNHRTETKLEEGGLPSTQFSMVNASSLSMLQELHQPPPSLGLKGGGLNLNLATVAKKGEPMSKQLAAEDEIISTSETQNKYSLKEKLGNGQFAEVWKASMTTTEGTEGLCAIKQEFKPGQSDAKPMEVQALEKLKDTPGAIHKHVLQLIDFFFVDGKRYIVTELCEKSLRDVIREQGVISERSARGVFRQLVQGLTGIHGAQIIHRDLKPENIMVKNMEKTSLNVKIGDFGSAVFSNPNAQDNEEGTLQYKAPEYFVAIINEETKIRELPGKQADVWALGVILYEMVFGQRPYPYARGVPECIPDDPSKEPEAVPFPSGPEDKQELKGLLSNLLAYKPHHRISLEQINTETWMTLDEAQLSDQPDTDFTRR